MTPDNTAQFEHFALCERAARIVADLQADHLPVTGFQVWDEIGKVQFIFRLPGGGSWSFMTPRSLLNRESVESLLNAYL